MEILPGIHSLPAADKGTVFVERMPPHVYLVNGEHTSAIIDAGFDHEEPLRFRLQYLDSIGKDKVDYIIVTHFHGDHLGGVPKIKEAKGGTIVMHSLDIPDANKAISPLNVEKEVKEGDVLDLGGTHLEFVHTPGHSPGHICIYLQEKKLMFTGDHVLGAGTTAINTQHGDMKLYIESLRKLLDYDIQMLLPGHGPIVKDPKGKIREQIQHRLEREEQVLGLLKEGRNTVDDMLQSIYPELDQGLWNNARGQIRAHLIKLQNEGKVKAIEEGKSYALVK